MDEAKGNVRLEAFSDGVFAIALTLLIIEIHPPSPESIASTADLWHALRHLTPAVFAFVLSFVVILITWVNHHGVMEMVGRSSPSFIFANGFLLLTVVFIPFPTALLGEFVLSDHAGPAVLFYNAVLAIQALAWIVMARTALNDRLGIDDKSTETLRVNGRHGYFAVALYSVFAIAALWIPVAIAVVTTLSWIFWLALGIRMKRA